MKHKLRFLSIVTALLMLLGAVCVPVYAEKDNGTGGIEHLDESTSYDDYMNTHLDKEYPNETAVALAQNATPHNTTLTTVTEDGEEYSVITLEGKETSADFEFDVKKSGLYNISLCYRIKEGGYNLAPVEIDITVDKGIAPDMNWLKALALDRVWENAEEITFDEKGNEVAPEQREVYVFIDMPLKDVYNNPFYYYFTEGKHIVSVDVCRGGVELSSLTLCNYADSEGYRKPDDVKAVKEYYQRIEAENYLHKSSASILPECDPANVETTPNNPVVQRLNHISGAQYKTVGSWIEWEIEVPNDGYYMIDMRARQNYNSGLSSIRKLTIDGAVPFSQASEIAFPYSDSWKLHTIGGEEPYWFYIKEGKHTLRLTATYGYLSNVVAYSQAMISKLNGLYNSVIMKIGSNPDKYRDYNLGEEIEGIDITLTELCKAIDTLGEMVLSTNDGKTGSAMSTIQTVKTMLKLFRSDPDQLALKMSTFKSNIEALAAWANSLNEQPLDIDWIRVYTKNAELPDEKVSFFAKLKFDIMRLCASFSSEYEIKDESKGDDELTVWVSAGRDQLKVLKKLIGSEFEPDNKADVTLAINTDITGAVLAGVGPDVCLFIDAGSPVNFAVRDVLVDLSKFEDFEKITSERFDETALVPFSSVEGCYAIPLTLSWPMMFVRNDIFNDLELTVPETWDDMYKVAAVLQRNHLEIGIPSHVGMFFTLLYQNGGQVFDSKLETTFNDEHSLKAFSTWTSFFSEYSFPLTYDFFNRFRSGEMPIGIADYTVYAQLKAAAPEIRGQWEMHMIPGVVDENGNINRTMSTSTATGTTQANGLQQGETCAIMFKACRNRKLAWEFLKWYTSDSVQTDYGLDIEAVLGYTGRYATANKNAISKLPWTADELEMLSSARKNIEMIDEYPGNYYIAREVNNAFRSVVNEGTNPADILSRKNVLINKELIRKYKQFDIKAGDDDK